MQNDLDLSCIRTILTDKDAKQILNSINTKIGYKSRVSSEFMDFPGSHPVTLLKKHMDVLINENYYVCEKSDGIRVLLHITTLKNKSYVFFIDRKCKVYLVDMDVCPIQNTLFDGELYIDTYKDKQQTVFSIFDTLIYNDEVVTEKNLQERLSYAYKYVYYNDERNKQKAEAQQNQTQMHKKTNVDAQVETQQQGAENNSDLEDGEVKDAVRTDVAQEECKANDCDSSTDMLQCKKRKTEGTRKNDTSKNVTSKNDASKNDASKNDTIENDTSQNDTSKNDTSKNDTSKNDTSKNVTCKNNTNKSNSIALVVKNMAKSYGFCEVYKTIPTLHHNNDGMIFTPVFLPYIPGRCDKLFKWKPAHLNSVDFLLKNIHDFVYEMQCYGKKNLLRTFDYFFDMADEPKRLHNKIVEMNYDSNAYFVDPFTYQSNKGGWNIYKIRTDKETPNSHKVVVNVLYSLQESLEYNDLEQYFHAIRDAWKERESQSKI